jgi:hypothetical protein
VFDEAEDCDIASAGIMIQIFEQPPLTVLTGEDSEREVCGTETRVVERKSSEDDLRPFEDPQLLPQITCASAGVRGHLSPKKLGT